VAKNGDETMKRIFKKKNGDKMLNCYWESLPVDLLKEFEEKKKLASNQL
jgi:hypothetical protein